VKLNVDKTKVITFSRKTYYFINKYKLFYSTLGCIFILYFTLVRSKVEYTSVVWNSIISTDANKLECNQQKYTALCYKRSFPQVDYCHDFALEQFKLHTLQKRRYHLDALFLIQVYHGSILYPSALEMVGLHVPVRNIRDFPMFNACSVSKNCPSARCASAANVVCRDIDVFGPKTLLWKHILY
ncbi:hypothetical protein B7P43_G08692, partial [Cryptotermes secundus]